VHPLHKEYHQFVNRFLSITATGYNQPMNHIQPIITLLTDFGELDAFVGIMKGVILRIVPDAQLVDLSHQVPPQDVRHAAFQLMTAVEFFPEGAVHLVVVDPGVGSARRPIAVSTPRASFVGPDNGVFTYALALAEQYTAVELTNPEYHLPDVSTTFHGRDIFSPTAAHLANGVPLSELGPLVKKIVQLDLPRLKVEEGYIEAEVLNIDHFGNLRTSIHVLTWEDDKTLSLQPVFGSSLVESPVTRISAKKARTQVGSLKIDGISETFSDVQIGQPVAMVGSEGGLDIAVNQGDAARDYGVKTGDLVSLHF
jgi:S-adenosylmethionine hydrolase